MSSSLDPTSLSLVAEYLPLGDIKVVKLVCKEWNDIVSLPRYFRNAVINITGTLNRGQATNQSLEEQYEYLNNSEVMDLVLSVCYRNAGRQNGEFTNEFWTRFGPQIQSLKFQNVVFESNEELEHVLSLCKNLSELIFEDCVTFLTDDINTVLPFQFAKLESIRFVRCNFTEDMYNALQLNVCPIKLLEFDCCFIRDDDCTPDHYETDLIYRTMVQEESYQTGFPFDCTQRFLIHSRSLTKMMFSNILPVAVNLDFALKNTLLRLQGFLSKEQHTAPSTFDCLRRHQDLEELMINVSFLDKQSVMSIGECFPALKQLSVTLLNWDIHILLSCISEVRGLKSLELTASKYDITQPSGFVLNNKSFAKSLRVLKCTNLPNCLIRGDMLGPAFPVHLRELRLNCPKLVDDDLMQNICKWLRMLQILDLSDCTKVTDNGLIGSCRSSKPSHGELVSIINLKGLQHLNLSGCEKITDLSLMRGLQFMELRFLDLSRCPGITNEGISGLGTQNPSLESLCLRGCKISNVGLIGIMRNAPRLKELDILYCRKVTLTCIDEMTKFCPVMRTVKINSLFSFKAAFELMKEKLPRCAIADDDPAPFASRPPIGGDSDVEVVFDEHDFFGG